MSELSRLQWFVGVLAALAAAAMAVLQPMAGLATTAAVAVIGIRVATGVPRHGEFLTSPRTGAWQVLLGAAMASLVAASSEFASPVIETARFAILALLVAFLAALSSEGTRTIAYRRAAVMFLAVPTFAAASTVWSMDPARTAVQASTFALVAACVLLVARKRWQDHEALASDLTFIFWLFIAVAAVGIAGWASGAPWATTGIQRRYSGIYANPNTAAMSASLILPLGVGLFAHSQRIRKMFVIGGMAILIGTLVLTESRTALAAGLLGTLLAVAATWRANRSYLLGLSWLIVVSTIVGVWFGIGLGSRFNRIAELGTHLTGRDLAWRALISAWQDSPWLGIGFRSTETLFADLQSLNILEFKQLTAHNGYLQTLAELGIVGMVIVSALMLFALRNGWRSRQLPIRAGVMGAVVSGLVTQVGESSIYGFGAVFALPFWMLLAAAATAEPDVRMGTRARIPNRNVRHRRQEDE